LRRTLLIGLVVTVVALAADRVAAHAAASQMSKQVGSSLNLPTRPEASVGGVPFPTQVVLGKYSVIGIGIRRIAVSDVCIDDIDVHLRGVHVPLRAITENEMKSVPVDHVVGSVHLTFSDLNAYLADKPGNLSLAGSGKGVRVCAVCRPPGVLASGPPVGARVPDSKRPTSIVYLIQSTRSKEARVAEADGGLVRVEVADGVAVLTLNDPGRRNALSYDMSQALAAAVDEALAAGPGALVLAAEPPVFCSGGSLDDLVRPKAPLRGMYEGFLRLADTPVPTVAAVGGPVIGAGLNLPMACDVILCSPKAVFDPRFLDVGIHPGGGHLLRLSRLVGAQGAAALILCGDRLTGEEAAEHGLAWRCVPDGELLAVALRLARRAAGRDRELVARAKESLRASVALTDPKAAMELELVAQEWAVSRPGFAEHVAAIKESLGRRAAKPEA
jgi:enoyl-CoA hydratase